MVMLVATVDAVVKLIRARRRRRRLIMSRR
jgi:hypothetical protein